MKVQPLHNMQTKYIVTLICPSARESNILRDWLVFHCSKMYSLCFYA